MTDEYVMLIIQTPFYWIVIACWALWAISEISHSIYSRKKEMNKTSNKSALGIYVCIFFLYIMYILSPLVPQILWLSPLALPLFIVGLISIAAGFSLRWTSILIMGEAFSRQIRTIDDQVIIRSGPFAYVRHPNYLAGFLMFVGFGLLFGSWLSLVMGIILGTSPYIYRIHVEELFLLKNLPGYDRYCKEVPYRLIPFVY